jgi:hypothetical protein
MILALLRALEAKTIEAVMYNGVRLNKKTGEVSLLNSPGAPLEKEYSLKCHYYWPDRKSIEKLLAKTGKVKFTRWREKFPSYRSFLDETFPEKLRNATLLYIGQYNHNSEILFNKYPNEIKAFLSKGGIIFFDYQGGVWPGLSKFLKLVNVKNPCSEWETYKEDFVGGYYVLAVNPAYENLPITKTPYKIQKILAYGWWTNWSDKQIIPFQNPKFPGKSASMIIKNFFRTRLVI